MTRRLIFNAFSMATVTHASYGTWRLPESRQREFADLGAWTELAHLLEEGCFDAIFFADIVGLHANYAGGWGTFVQEGLQLPILDPAIVASALLPVTSELGFVLTSSVLQDHPFSFARKLSTFDHLSAGRIGWNVVTSSLENAAENFGHAGRVEHDERYRWAQEYSDVTYKLWEGSWDDGAVVDDVASGIYGDPDRVHKIDHVGNRYSVPGPHLVSPSPQRTPVLAQAGTSNAGRDFAAKNAELVFLMEGSPQSAQEVIGDIRRRAASAGRLPEDIKFLQGLSVVTGASRPEAQAKAERLDQAFSLDAFLAHRSGLIGIDLAGIDLDSPLEVLPEQIEGTQSLVAAIRAGLKPGVAPTVRDFVRHQQEGVRIVGDAAHVADELERWQAAGIDGVNLRYNTTPGTFVDFIEFVAPELRSRGLMQTSYAPGTLRRKLFGVDGLSDRHPASAWRGAFRSDSHTSHR